MLRVRFAATQLIGEEPGRSRRAVNAQREAPIEIRQRKEQMGLLQEVPFDPSRFGISPRAY